MQVVTDTGKPPMIDKVWFFARYGQNFPDLLNSAGTEVEDSIETVYTIFAGVSDLWNHLDRKTYVNKTQVCYGLLVAWYMTDLFPDYAEGVMSSGGIPVKSKKIGGTQITFEDSASVSASDLLQSLKSNAFGAKAYMMIKASGKINLFLKH